MTVLPEQPLALIAAPQTNFSWTKTEGFMAPLHLPNPISLFFTDSRLVSFEQGGFIFLKFYDKFP